MSVMDDMHLSMRYVKKFKGVIESLMNGCKIMPVEGSGDEVCKMLDMSCGCDYFQVYDEKLLCWGVASRFQMIDTNKYRKPFNTFTIRKSRDSGAVTEFAKRKAAIKNGGVYPFLTMQGYVNQQTDDLMSLAIAKTTDVFEYIEKHGADTNHTGANQQGQASFYVVKWDDFEKKGYKIQLYVA